MTVKTLIPLGSLCHGSQYNGIVWYGRVVGYVHWDGGGVDAYAVRYLYSPDGDPPRRPYRISPVQETHAGLPQGPNWPTEDQLVAAEL